MSLDIFERGTLPRWLPVRQRLDEGEIDDVPLRVAEVMRSQDVVDRIPAGSKVAVAVGSRGIDRIDEVTRAVVAELRRIGAEPFIVPAMGSHGGATAEGQRAMLAHLGVTEEAVGAPIRASMETVHLGEVADGVPVYFDRIAATDADLVIPIGRVKPHTDFKGPTESGLIKMIAIGLGKQKGADTLHARGDVRFAELLPRVAALTLERIHIPFGIALVENGRSRLALIEAVMAEEMYERERALLEIAREKMPRLPGTRIDVLVIDEIGKDISGTGADTNVINRFYRGPLEAEPRIQRIIVRGLTEDTAGNAAGIGMADVILRRAALRVDPVKTYMNCITAKKPEEARLPITVENDRQALYIALACCIEVEPETARIARIENTQSLSTLWVSEPWWDRELHTLESLTALGPPEPMRFDAEGMFVS